MILKLVRLGAPRSLVGPSTSRLFRAFKHASAVDEPLTRPKPITVEPFLGSNSSGTYVEEMYSAWEADPKSVHLSWRLYFSNLEQGRLPAYQAPPTLMPGTSIQSTPSSSVMQQNIQLKADKMVKKFVDLGHRAAKLDPLGLNEPIPLDFESMGISSKELDTSIELSSELLPGYFKEGVKTMALKEIVSILQKTYCSSIGFEFSHVSDPKKVQWIQERIESPNFYQSSKQERELALRRLTDAESFERMFATKFATVKRYGVEGGDSMLPALMSIIDHCGDKDVNSVVIGMPHRGRLNVYSNIMGNPAEEVFAEFSGKAEPPHPWSGDSSYHLACENELTTPSGKKVDLSLTANPSHLEAVHPVALGATRAKQGAGKEAMAIIIHGDAAMAGQGVVYEAMGFHHLPKYETGGSIHMVVNNQIGFTTNPFFSRSTLYCCDVAKMAEAPVLHVNGDDVDAVLAATKLAVEWRQTFRQDIFIDLVCYRKNGHNEVDQPSYTQPKMYAAISKHVPVLEAYSKRLVREGAVSQEKADQIKNASWERMEKAYAASRGFSPKSKQWISQVQGLMSPEQVNSGAAECPPTGAKSEHLKRVAEMVSKYPSDFQVHPNLVKVLQARERMAVEGTSIDWATAEQLAFGTLLLEGTSVRISGQDVERGTFSQRHSVLVDQASEKRHIPLNDLSESQGSFHPCNSHLSEFGVLGFELGYSVSLPNSLVLWEAQFGDFSNVAQCMIDQFVASGEQKWLQQTGLTMLLPHGFDGNGPEHSSGRLERYLQLTDEDPHFYPDLSMQHQKTNWSIVSCTTPANYFHALRRQVRRPFRKPLVSFNGKGLLRHPLSRSTTADLEESGPGFQRAYPEQFPQELAAPDQIRAHILCTGQVYLRLLRARQQNDIKDVAISRIEELAPFPFDLVADYCKTYPNAELVWCQEEPVNMGAYSHVLPRIETALAHHQLAAGPIRYAGRAPSAAVAVGNKTRHLQEDSDLISSALYGQPRPVKSIVNGVSVF